MLPAIVIPAVQGQCVRTIQWDKWTLFNNPVHVFQGTDVYSNSNLTAI